MPTYVHVFPCRCIQILAAHVDLASSELDIFIPLAFRKPVTNIFQLTHWFTKVTSQKQISDTSQEGRKPEEMNAVYRLQKEMSKNKRNILQIQMQLWPYSLSSSNLRLQKNSATIRSIIDFL